MIPLIFSGNPVVSVDIDNYRRLLDSKGGALGDGSLSEAEAMDRLRAWVTQLYAICGRMDFWPLQAAYQVGSGSKCYSFQGLEGTLVNGLGWTSNGLKATNQDQYVLLPDSYDDIVLGPHWMAAAYKRSLDEYDQTAMFDFSGYDVMLGQYSLMDDVIFNNRRSFLYTDNSDWGGVAATGPSASDTWNYYIGGFNSDRTGAYIYQNGTLLASSSGRTINPTGTIIKRRMLHSWTLDAIGNYGAMMAFGLVGKGSVDATKAGKISSAYKTTIGKDLGLS